MNNKLYSKILRCDFEKLFAEKGYTFFTKGSYNLNIIGVRASGTTVTNKFDDFIVVIYKSKGGSWKKLIYEATTDPGLYYMKTPINANGTAILVPGQYRAAYKIGLHRKKYKALVQIKPIKVYRDRNKDEVYDLDPNTEQEGVFGLNIHKAGTFSTKINNWSAGCQVFANASKFDSFLRLCSEQIKNGMGEKFTYTLVTEEDLCE